MEKNGPNYVRKGNIRNKNCDSELNSWAMTMKYPLDIRNEEVDFEVSIMNDKFV